MTTPTIISIGEVLWDQLPEGEQFGGAPANFACHASMLGADVSMLSAVGEDRRGQVAISTLKRYGLNVDLMQVTQDAATGTVGVDLDSNGKPTFTIHENSAWDRLTWNSKLEARIVSVDAVYFGTLGQRSEIARSTIQHAIRAAGNITRILDINLRTPFFNAELIRESIELASILKLSDEELPIVCDACEIVFVDDPASSLAVLLEKYSLDRVVMTRGAEGAVLATSEGILQQPGFSTTVVDTVGAGDAFAAAFLLGLLRKESHESNLKNACVVASQVCAHAGAVPDSPSNC